MIRYKNLTILGTSHIAIQSINEVKGFIIENKPEIIALELDQRRFLVLSGSKEEKLRFGDIRKLGLKGYIFNLIGAWIEKKLGNLVGVSPGSEMKLAIDLAIKQKAQIALIDQDIIITLKRLSKLRTKEKIKFVYDLIKGFIIRKQEYNFDLRKVPPEELIKKVLRLIKKRYPHLYKILIHERNSVMAKNLYTIIKNNKEKKVFVIVGAGHLPGLLNEIKKYDKF